MTDQPSPFYVRSGNFEEDLANGQRLLERDPAAALKQAEELVRLKQDARVFRLAAAACRKLGYKADAEGAELGAIQASLAEPEMKSAALAEAEGSSADALAIARQYLQANPDDLLAMTVIAEASINLWELEEAEEQLRAVIRRAPTFLRASMLLATCLIKQVRMGDAIAVLDEVVARKPNNVPALTFLAQSRATVGDVEEAASIYEKLLALDSRRVEWWVHLGQHYRSLGRREDAIGAFRQALSIEPSNASAWWTLANYYTREIDDQDKATIDQALTEQAGNPQEGSLHLALGLVADRDGNHAEAFDHFAQGKRIRLAHQPYDPDRVSAGVDSVIEIFTPEFFERRKTAGWQDSSPIFIVGLPRSGTTLVERILGRHSAVEGAGELQIIPRLAEVARRKADNPEDYAAMLESLADTQLAWVGRRYVEASHDFRRTDKPMFIDKANLNWMQIGLILLVLPDAKVIDVRRGALDCCWANFKMLFAEGYPAANDLRHVGLFYRDYVRMFDAMHRAAPGRILSVRYEDVVDDIEGQTRRMLDSLGLEFEQQCLDFHLAKDAVATASSEQVRQPLNRKGIGSAAPYRQWLGPLIEELGPLAGAP
jgi:cytochrome c-type biogenesis protein CcmH/NrfG